MSIGRIDVQDIVTKLMKIEEQNLHKLERKKDGDNVHINTYTALQDLLTKLTAAFDTLDTSFTTNNVVTSSNESLITAAVNGTPSPGSHSIAITNVATSQTMVSSSFSSSAFVPGVGETLSFSVGSANFTVNVGAGDSIQTICNNINAANGNEYITATPVQTGSGQCQIVLTSSQTGAANQVTINGDSGNVFNFTTTQPASDAVFVFDGITISESTNTITDVIPGLTFTLQGSSTGQNNVILTISPDPNINTTITTNVQNLLTAYNAIMSFIDKCQADRDTQDAGLSAIKNKLQQAMNSTLKVSGSYHSISDIGILLSDAQQQKIVKTVLDKDGKEVKKEIKYMTSGQLEFNKNIQSYPFFAKAIANDFQSLKAFFTDESNGLANLVETQTIDDDILLFNPKPGQGTGEVSSRMTYFNQQVMLVNQSIADEESRLRAVREGLISKYTKLNNVLAHWDQQKEFLERQLSIMSNMSKSKG